LKGKTLMLITHRPSLLRLVDRIILLEGGRVVADGPRDAVLAQIAQVAA
jgi:ATP-binding cassette subfamily C protein LapB